MIYLATYKHRDGNHFTAAAITRGGACSAMLKTLRQHASEHRLRRTWFVREDIDVREIELGVGYRNGEQLPTGSH